MGELESGDQIERNITIAFWATSVYDQEIISRLDLFLRCRFMYDKSNDGTFWNNLVLNSLIHFKIFYLKYSAENPLYYILHINLLYMYVYIHIYYIF